MSILNQNAAAVRPAQDKTAYSEAEVRKWLSWLALQMQLHGKSIFQIEEMQPTWLGDLKHLKNFLYIIGIIAGLFNGLIGGLFYWQIDGISVGLGAIGVGLFGGFLAVSIHLLRFQGRMKLDRFFELPVFIVVIILTLFFSTVIGLTVGLYYGLGDGLAVGLIHGVFLGLFLGIKGVGRNLVNDIQPVERLKWSWAKARRSGLQGFVIGLLIGACCYFIVEQIRDLNFAAIDIFIFGITGAIAGILFGGTISAVVEMHISPNQGIRLSVRNASLMSGAGLIVGLCFALMQTLGLISGLNIRLIDNLDDGLLLLSTMPFAFAITAWLWFGGQDVIKHFVLRYLLYRNRKMPMRYAHFLDYASNELNFLQKVGGGYMFVHRYLLEHFASMADEITTLKRLKTELNLESESYQE